MNQERKSTLSFLVPGLITACITLIVLMATIAIASRVLISFDHFERFYEISCYLVWGISALLLSFVAKKTNNNPFPFTLFVLLTVSVLVVLIGYLLGAGTIYFPHLGLRIAFYCALSLLLILFPSSKTGRKKRSKR